MAIKKSAIIPYRFVDEKLEILLITRSSGHGWGIPKGKIEEPLAPHVSAAKEAFEEGGVLGRAYPVSIGTYLDHSKSGPIPTFFLEVEIELTKKDWPERKKRARLWVDAGDCERYVTDKRLLAVIEKGATCLRSKGEYFKHIIKSFCEEHEWNLVELNGERAEIEIKLAGAGRRRIRALRKGSTVRLSATGSVSFRSEKEMNAFSTELLRRNAQTKIGCWCIEEGEDYLLYSCTHSAKLKLLDGGYFADIATGLAKEWREVESIVKRTTASSPFQ